MKSNSDAKSAATADSTARVLLKRVNQRLNTSLVVVKVEEVHGTLQLCSVDTFCVIKGDREPAEKSNLEALRLL